MNDKTIVKPTPGRRNSFPKSDKANDLTQSNAIDDDSDKTVVFENASYRPTKKPVLTISDNSVVDKAGHLLSLCCQLRIIDSHSDVAGLRAQCVDLIKSYEQDLRSESLNSDIIESSRYCICCFLDETVLNTKWGENSSWASESLLSTFHNETFGGEYFYTLLDNALQSPATKWQLLELMYLCLSLGFIGKMRFEERGQSKLEDYRESAYRVVKDNKPKIHRELSPGWKEKIAKGSELQQSFPVWVAVTFFAAVMLFVYMGFSYKVNEYSSPVYGELTHLIPKEDIKLIEGTPNRSEFILLQQQLQTEIQRELVTLTELNDRIRISINASYLFASASAQPRQDFEVVLSKIARTLESTKGKILITGHADDRKIFTTRFPSNWHLSLARATSIANVLSRNGSLSGRLWPEGRGADEPLVENNSDENRAINRRIEIDLLY